MGIGRLGALFLQVSSSPCSQSWALHTLGTESPAPWLKKSCFLIAGLGLLW